MQRGPSIGIGVIMVVCMSLGLAAHGQTNSAPNSSSKGTAMATHAKGTFEVKLNPQTPDGPRSFGIESAGLKDCAPSSVMLNMLGP